jgi:site-specific recombinase XerC
MGEGRRCKVKLIKEPSGGRCHVKQPLRETVGQIVPMNPAVPVRGPKHVVKTGKTPVLEGDEWRKLLASIPTTTFRDLRDRALIATLTYSFASAAPR